MKNAEIFEGNLLNFCEFNNRLKLDLNQSSQSLYNYLLRKQIAKNNLSTKQIKSLLRARRINEALLAIMRSENIPDSGRKRFIEACLENKSDFVSSEDIRHYIPLYFSCLAGNEQIAELLIKFGAQLEARNSNNSTPLHLVCFMGDEKIAALLVKHGAELDVKNNDGNTALHAACMAQNIEIIRLLIEARQDSKPKLDINNQNNAGNTALSLICSFGAKQIAELLIENGARLDIANNDGNTPLHMACDSGCEEMVGLLMRYGAELENENKKGHRPLHIACGKRHRKIVKLLIEVKVGLDSRDNICNNTALHIACSLGDKEIAELLIRFGAKPNIENKYGHNPLHISYREGYVDLIKILIKAGANIREEHDTPELSEERKQLVPWILRLPSVNYTESIKNIVKSKIIDEKIRSNISHRKRSSGQISK